jgi:hypothetical protein
LVEEEEEEGDSEKFFDTCLGSASTSNASAGSPRHRHRRLKSDDGDREKDGEKKDAADEYRGFEEEDDDEVLAQYRY